MSSSFNKNIAISSKDLRLLQDIQHVWVNHIDAAIITPIDNITYGLFVTVHEDWVTDGFRLIPYVTVETYPNAQQLTHIQKESQ